MSTTVNSKEEMGSIVNDIHSANYDSVELTVPIVENSSSTKTYYYLNISFKVLVV